MALLCAFVGRAKTVFEIRVNGKKAEPRVADFFAEITVRARCRHRHGGLRSSRSAERVRRCIPTKYPVHTGIFRGPLLLGSATDNAAEPLVPILDLLGPGGPRRRTLRPTSQTAHCSPPRTLPPTGKPRIWRKRRRCFVVVCRLTGCPAKSGKLFGALKHDRTLAICGFVWPKPQKVRQVILQWPESAAMPKPEDVVLCWLDAGVYHDAAQPGIIGNGRQWVYTLGKAPEGAVIDNLVADGEKRPRPPPILSEFPRLRYCRPLPPTLEICSASGDHLDDSANSLFLLGARRSAEPCGRCTVPGLATPRRASKSIRKTAVRSSATIWA